MLHQRSERPRTRWLPENIAGAPSFRAPRAGLSVGHRLPDGSKTVEARPSLEPTLLGGGHRWHGRRAQRRWPRDLQAVRRGYPQSLVCRSPVAPVVPPLDGPRASRCGDELRDRRARTRHSPRGGRRLEREQHREGTGHGRHGVYSLVMVSACCGRKRRSTVALRKQSSTEGLSLTEAKEFPPWTVVKSTMSSPWARLEQRRSAGGQPVALVARSTERTYVLVRGPARSLHPGSATEDGRRSWYRRRRRGTTYRGDHRTACAGQRFLADLPEEAPVAMG